MRDIIDNIPEEERLINRGVKVLPNGERVVTMSLPDGHNLDELKRFMGPDGSMDFTSFNIQDLLRQHRESQR
jgi:hypothetical protein